MTIPEIKAFLEQADHGFITVHGGEPCLHPDWEEIAELMLAWRKAKDGRTVWWLTNMHGSVVQARVAEIEAMGLAIGRAEKPLKVMYIPVNESPTDLGLPWTRGCFQTATCGVAYNKRGYYPCSPMAAAARVFGYEPCELDQGVMAEYMLRHCRHCGFAIDGRARRSDQVTTRTWEEALSKYER
jgi:hypothetical protein